MLCYEWTQFRLFSHAKEEVVFQQYHVPVSKYKSWPSQQGHPGSLVIKHKSGLDIV